MVGIKWERIEWDSIWLRVLEMKIPPIRHENPHTHVTELSDP